MVLHTSFVCRLVGVYPDQPEAGLCRYQGGAELAPAKLLPSEYSNGVESGPGPGQRACWAAAGEAASEAGVANWAGLCSLKLDQ